MIPVDSAYKHHENMPIKFCPHPTLLPTIKPHFYIVKLGFTRVYIIFFLFLLKNTNYGTR